MGFFLWIDFTVFPLFLSGILLGIRREADCLFSALARLWFYALAIGYGVNDVGETRLDRRMDFLWSAHTVNSLYGSLLVSAMFCTTVENTDCID